MAEREQMLRELLEKIAEQHNYKDARFKIEATSSEGANYSSVLYKLTITSPNKKPLCLFAKVLNFDENTRAAFADAAIFDIEYFVYVDLATIFKNLEDKCAVPDEERYKFPKFYYFHPKVYEETIILEDLAVQGYELYDRLKSVDWPYASKAIEALAKFHALAMAYEQEKPEEYKKILTEYDKKIEPAFDLMSASFEKFVETALSATKEENKEKLKKFCDKQISIGNVFRRYIKAKRKPVLIHGDFRQSNIMHKYNENGTLDLIPLDYQTIQTGSCVIDLLYFIFSGSNAEFRARYYQRLVDHYYDNLKNSLIRLRLDPEKIYPRKDFDYELREALPYGLIVSIFVLPVVTVAPENAPDLNSADMFERLAKPKVSNQYIDRINGVIDDFVKWGIL
ncbi:uncharacterized protein LOC128676696 [Plodia interpunctella]|uniref:uncharacterized protein LOC128676696 n=1 Tax=Plodia interpunctella TaxID=58824 RepID=UPI0023683CB3|nr:uncharacterized protein LOC128676696 [Plodia interpunctella]